MARSLRIPLGRSLLALGAITISALVATPVQASQPFDVVATINVAFTSEMVVLGDYGYVANNGAVHVIDLATNTVDETVTDANINYPDGAAAIGTKVYFASRDNDKLVTFDTITRTVTTVDTNTGVTPSNCDKPSQLMVVNATRLIANCQTSGSVQIYDVSTNPTSIVATVTTGTEPRNMSVNDGIVYVPNSFGAPPQQGTMSAVDAAAATPSASAAVPVGDQPEGTAYLDGKVFVVNIASHEVSIIDAASNSLITNVSLVANSAPQGVATCGRNVYTANRNAGTTSVISPVTNSEINTIQVAPAGQTTHVIGSNNGYAYLLNFSNSTVTVVNCYTQSVMATVPVAGPPSKISFASERAYVTTPGSSGKITVIAIPEGSSDPGDSSDTDQSIPGARYVDFHFLLPDGRECTAISPVRVRVGTMYQLPGVDASCQTVPGSSVAGWTIPVPHGFTGYGSAREPFPPGLSVRVVDSQRFTVVPQEPTLRADFDANIAAHDSCVQTKTLHTSRGGRVEHVWVPRADIEMARFPTSSSCIPDDQVLIGWNTIGDGTGDVFAPGAAMPTDWADDHTNNRHLYAVWAPATD